MSRASFYTGSETQLPSGQLEVTEQGQSAESLPRRYIGKAALLLCIFAILFLRDPKCITHPELWAEDGAMFFRQQLLSGARAILLTSGGYLQLAPRILALVTAAFPVAWAPLLYAIESILVAGACCWAFVLNPFRAVFRSELIRGVLCLVAATGFPAQELIGNITNVQWFFMLVAVPLTLVPPRCRTGMSRVLFITLGLLIALSAPLTIVLLPLIAIRAMRTRSAEYFSLAIAAGTLIEWVVIARHWTPHGATVHEGLLATANALAFTTLVAFTNQVMMFCLLGRAVTQGVWTHDYGGFSLVLLLSFACAQVVLYRSGSREYRTKVRIFMWLILSALVLAMLRGMEPVFSKMSSVQPFGSHRYYLLACWCLALLVSAAILDRRPHWPERKQTAVLAAIFLFGAIGNFRVASQFATEWQPYASEVQAWQADRNAGREHAEVTVPISPKGWVVDLPKLEASPAK